MKEKEGRKEGRGEEKRESHPLFLNLPPELDTCLLPQKIRRMMAGERNSTCREAFAICAVQHRDFRFTTPLRERDSVQSAVCFRVAASILLEKREKKGKNFFAFFAPQWLLFLLFLQDVSI